MLMPSGTMFKDDLVTYGNAPGYRDIHVTLNLNEGRGVTRKVKVWLSGEDSLALMRHVADVQRMAWQGEGPIDVQPGERRPKDI